MDIEFDSPAAGVSSRDLRQLQCLGPSASFCNKALGILEKNLTKWGVEEEDNQFFAKIDHWVECLKHVFFFSDGCILHPQQFESWYLRFSKNPKIANLFLGAVFGDERLYNLNSFASPFRLSRASLLPSVLRSF